MNNMLRRDDPETPGRNSRFDRYRPALFNINKVFGIRQTRWGDLSCAGPNGGGQPGSQFRKRSARFSGQVVDSVWPAAAWTSTVRSAGEAIQASMAPAAM